MEKLLRRVDHLVFAVPVLEEGIEYIYHKLGVRAQIGGQHLGKGTWNALLALSLDSYLEIIAPDPKQDRFGKGAWMEVDKIAAPRMIHWAAKVNPIEKVLQSAAEQGIHFGELSGGSRTKMNGDVISWTLTEPVSGDDGMIVPFLIDWEDSIHPANNLKQECKLVSLEGMHPAPLQIARHLEVLKINMPVNPGHQVRLKAKIQSPKGIVDLF